MFRAVGIEAAQVPAAGGAIAAHILLEGQIPFQVLGEHTGEHWLAHHRTPSGNGSTQPRNRSVSALRYTLVESLWAWPRITEIVGNAVPACSNFDAAL